MTEPVPTTPDRAALEAELLRVESEFPPPDAFAYLRDAEWFDAAAARGELDHLFGQLVTVYEGRVVRVGGHELLVRMELARQYNEHPQRFYVSYHGDLLDDS